MASAARVEPSIPRDPVVELEPLKTISLCGDWISMEAAAI